jgi:hypothetical protein
VVSAVDLDAIKAEWLTLCPPCDAGVPGNCVCPDSDPRPVIEALIGAIERLGSQLDEAAAELLQARAMRDERTAEVLRLEETRAGLQRNIEVLCAETAEINGAREVAEFAASNLRSRLKVISDACNDAQNRLYAVRMLKVWADKDGKEFVLASDLRHAIDPEFNPATGGGAS